MVMTERLILHHTSPEMTIIACILKRVKLGRKEMTFLLPDHAA